MKESYKTIAYVGVAGVLVLSALLVHLNNKPPQIEQFAKVGEEFFPEFESAAGAEYLEVAAYDMDTDEVKKFRIEQKDSVWRIPTHYDYPAEAADRLAKTATSIIGIKRKALAGRRKSKHAKFGVVDPLAEGAKKEEETGERITLGAGDEILADFIVGNKVENDESDEDARMRELHGEGPPAPMFYVRRPDEDETYKATLALDVSTKFSDWIDPDLFRMEEGDIRELLINKYAVELKEVEVQTPFGPGVRQQGVKSETETQKLTREFGQWKLDGMDEEKEELETSKISDITRGLAGLEIKGVRPRYRFKGHQMLSPQLTLEIPEEISSQRELNDVMVEVQADLSEKGFTLGQSESAKANELELVSDRGEMSVATAEGLVYHLYFGKQIVGSDEEIEIGGATAVEDEKPKEDGGEKSDEETETEDEESDPKKKSRYLLVRVEFDEERVEGKPTEPIKPVEPQKPDAPKDGDAEKPTTKPPTGQPPTKPPADTSGEDAAKKPDANAEKSGEKDSDAKDSDAKDSDAKKAVEKESDAKDSDDSKTDEGSTESGDEASTDDANDCDAFQDEDQDENQDKKQSDDPADDKSDDSASEKPSENDEKNGKQEDTTPKTDDADPKTDDADPKTDDKKASDEGSEDPAKTADPAKVVPPKPDPQAVYQQAMMQYNQQMQQYVSAVKQYEEDLKKYEDEVEKKRLKAAELTERFGSWYYVVPADNLEELRLSRSDLVKDKPEPEPKEGPTGPGVGGSQIPGLGPNFGAPPKNPAPKKDESPTEKAPEKEQAAEEKEAPENKTAPEKSDSDSAKQDDSKSDDSESDDSNSDDSNSDDSAAKE